MADEQVLRILQIIQDAIIALDRKVGAVDAKVDGIDNKFARQFAVLAQDVRMVRSSIHDMAAMAATRVSKGEIAVLYEDVTRIQQTVEKLVARVEILEGQTDHQP
jgi:hypothetical protein